MALDWDLLAEFAKITNDSKKKTSSETTMYATVVKQNDKFYVKLDGSEILTPVLRTTNVQDGERVTVMIKNHTAVITGNLSSPAARLQDIGDIGDAAELIVKFQEELNNKVGTDDFNDVLQALADLSSDIEGAISRLNGLDTSIADLNAALENLEDVTGTEVNELLEELRKISASIRYDDIFVGSVTLVGSPITISDSERHDILTGTSGNLLEDLFSSEETPSGYRRAWKLSVLGSNKGTGALTVGFNGEAVVSLNTGTDPVSPRSKVSDKFYSWQDFPEETVSGGREAGLTLFYQLGAASLSGQINSITLMGYFERIGE